MYRMTQLRRWQWCSILVWRCAQVERTKKRAAAQAAAEARERAANRSWVGWLTGAGGGGGKANTGGAGEGQGEGEDADMRGELNDEEREALQGLAAEQEDALKMGAGRPLWVGFGINLGAHERWSCQTPSDNLVQRSTGSV